MSFCCPLVPLISFVPTQLVGLEMVPKSAPKTKFGGKLAKIGAPLVVGVGHPCDVWSLKYLTPNIDI